MGHIKNQRILDQFAARLEQFLEEAELTPKQVALATGISKRHVELALSGNINTSIGYVAAYAELLGVELHNLVNFKGPIPDGAELNASIKKYIKAHGIDAKEFFESNEGATNTLEKLLKTTFLNQLRYTREIAEYCKEKYDVEFTTSRLSKVLDNFYKEGRVEKLETDKKSKYQYRKVG